MKKFFCALLAGSFLLSLSACSLIGQPKQPESQMESELTTTSAPPDVKALSECYAANMAVEGFQTVADHFSLSLKAKLSTDELKNIWNTTTEKFGKFQKIYKSIKTENSQYTTVIEILQYENDGLQVVFSFNSDGEIEDLYIKAYTILSSLMSNNTFEETAIQIGSGGYLLDGILTMPKNVKNPPVVILVQDSGQADLNETTGTVHNKPFQDIAWGLAEKGIATIRYNQRFYQYPQLYSKTSTIQDEVLNDVGSAVQYAKSSPLINAKKIIILGSGLGGMLTPKMAQDNKDVEEIVIMAGSPRKLEDIIVDRTKKAGVTDEQAVKLEEQAEQIKNLTSQDDTDILGENSHYWYSVNQIDTPGIAKQLTIPILILQGSDDIEIDADTDYDQWKSLLGSQKNVTFHLYDGLNHLFMQSNGKTDATEYDLAGHVDDSVIADIAKFTNAK